MYKKIINPLTGRKVSIYGKTGKKILKNYLNILGGAQANAAIEPHVNIEAQLDRVMTSIIFYGMGMDYSRQSVERLIRALGGFDDIKKVRVEQDTLYNTRFDEGNDNIGPTLTRQDLMDDYLFDFLAYIWSAYRGESPGDDEDDLDAWEEMHGENMGYIE